MITDPYANRSNVPYINAREARIITPRPKALKIDSIISKIVGRPVLATDPKLINLMVKWKKSANKSEDDMKQDNFLEDPKKLEELKHVLGNN